MFENVVNFFKGLGKSDKETKSKDAAKERLHLVLMQDRANVSVDFLDLMKQEILDVIKKYIEVDESSIDVRLTNKPNGDGSNGAPALYANIPILDIKEEVIQKMDIGKSNNVKKSDEIKENKVNKTIENRENVTIERPKSTSGNNVKNTNVKNTNNKNTNNKNTNSVNNKNRTGNTNSTNKSSKNAKKKT